LTDTKVTNLLPNALLTFSVISIHNVRLHVVFSELFQSVELGASNNKKKTINYWIIKVQLNIFVTFLTNFFPLNPLKPITNCGILAFPSLLLNALSRPLTFH